MGMFDYVAYETPCYNCQEPIKEWQTKDGDCVMAKLSVEQVRNFYGLCQKCKKWNEYKVVPVKYQIIRVEID
jgi:hypothetical protein